MCICDICVFVCVKVKVSGVCVWTQSWHQMSSPIVLYLWRQGFLPVKCHHTWLTLLSVLENPNSILTATWQLLPLSHLFSNGPFIRLSEKSVNNPLHFWNMGYPLVAGTLSEEQDQFQLTDIYQMPSVSGSCTVLVSQYLLQLCTDTGKSRRAGLAQVFTCAMYSEGNVFQQCLHLPRVVSFVNSHNATHAETRLNCWPGPHVNY